MIFSYNSVRNFYPIVGDEGEIYVDGDIQWVKVTSVSAGGETVECRNEHGNVFTFYTFEAFVDAVGDV